MLENFTHAINAIDYLRHSRRRRLRALSQVCIERAGQALALYH